MADVIPFKALRPVESFVKDVASYPYDVIDSDEARILAKDNPKSFLHVVKSEIDLPEDVNLYDPQVYAKARQNLHGFIDEGVFCQEQKPCFYIYRQAMGSHAQYGIVACVSAADYEADLIKKHELTRADKEADRTRHVDIVNANTGPVLITYRASEIIDRIVEGIVNTQPGYDFVADDGIAHTAWVVDDDKMITEIRNELDGIDALYIADGHHRAASAVAVARKRRASNPQHTGREDYNYFMAVLFPHTNLKIIDYNRVVKDLYGLSEEEFLAGIAEKFAVSEGFPTKTPQGLHQFGMYLKGRWFKLEALEGSYDPNDVVGVLDVSIIQNNLLAPVLGIQNPRTDERILFVGGVRGMQELERLVDSGKYAVAFSLYPTTLDQLMNIADQGKIMPPKSTWFEPKLRSGIFVHLLD